jgi:peptidyl-prolyl cis-trans isomerase SurA
MKALKTTFVLFFIIFFNSFQGFSQTLEKIIAKVDNHVVLLSDLEYQFAQMVEEKRIANTPQAKCQVLQNMIFTKMFLAKSEIDSIKVEDKNVESECNERWLMMTADIDLKEFEQRYGKKPDVFKSELCQSLRDEQLTQKMKEKITKNVKVTPSEVRKFYNKFPKDSLPLINSEIEVSQIIKIPAVSKEEKQRIKARLEDLKDRILKGESFEELAKKYCEDGSRDKGGDLGWQKRGAFVPAFEAVAFKLKKGEVSKVAETQFGFHLIKLYERRGDEYHCGHILVMPDWSRTDVEPAKVFLDSIAKVIRKDSLRFEKAALEFSDDKGAGTTNTAINGGALTGRDGSARIPLSELDSFISIKLDKMKVGDVSEPIPYRTADGKQAVRILYYKATHAAHEANFEEDYQKLYNAAVAEKKNKVLLEWFKKSKNEVYIQIDEEYKSCTIFGNQ